jgi:DNA-binding PadR family transcriptional regulator
MRKLSELEGAVLGVVSGHEPLTPYQVRKVFAHSPNPHWSASAGSIYPLIRRLARQRLLAARGHATGARKSLKYTLTAGGRRELRAWILAVEHTKVATTSDLVRLRVFFLAALAGGERRKFVDRMIQKLAAVLARDRAYCRERERAGDRFGHLGARGSLLMNRARLQWLKEVRAKLQPVGGKG